MYMYFRTGMASDCGCYGKLIVRKNNLGLLIENSLILVILLLIKSKENKTYLDSIKQFIQNKIVLKRFIFIGTPIFLIIVLLTYAIHKKEEKEILEEVSRLNKLIKEKYQTNLLPQVTYGDSAISFEINDIYKHQLTYHDFLGQYTLLLFLNRINEAHADFLSFIEKSISDKNIRIWCIVSAPEKEIQIFQEKSGLKDIVFIEDANESFKTRWGFSCPCNSIVMVDKQGIVFFVSDKLPEKEIIVQIIKNKIEESL